MKVDKVKKSINVSVKDLISVGLERNSISSPFSLRIRAAQGSEIHRNYQKSKSIGVKSEKFIKMTFKVSDWDFHISGRADCVIENGNKVIIEEIKSVLNMNQFSTQSETVGFYKKQLLIYSQYFFIQGKAVKSRLVLIDVISKLEKKIPIKFTDQGDYIKSQCKKILKLWKSDENKRKAQRKRADSISFPFSTYRPHQNEIVEHTKKILKQKGQLMLLAPSGLGKTAGTLFPALRYAMKKNKRLFVVTSKTTQQKIYRDTLRLFKKNGGKFHSIILTAKEKQCNNDVFLCEKNVCKCVENYDKVDISEAVQKCLTRQIITAKYTKKIAEEYQICPFELSLDCSLSCDVIIGDFNYVFNPLIRLKRFFDRSYKDIILIIDEAHNLPFRAMDYYSPSLTLDEITEAEEHLRSLKLPRSVISKGIKILQTLSRYYHSVLTSNQSESDIQSPKKTLISIDRDVFSKVFKEMERFILQYIVSFTKSEGAFPALKDKLLVFAFNLKQFYGILTESESAEFSQIADYSEKNLKILCKSAAEKLKKQINGFHSVIAQSATFFPVEYFRRMLGFTRNASVIEFASPFPKENHLYMNYPHLSTKYQDRSGSYDEIADILFKTVSVKPGNYLAFFPSFSYMNAVLNEIKKLPLPIKLLVQERKMSESKRKLYLNKLKKGESPQLLMGVLGGIFSEGIDFIGDMAIGAFIVGPGLPAYCFEQELKKKYFNQRWNKGFEYAYRNIGMMKVIQAAGRIFRSPTDRGIVMLIGQRFINKYYRSVLPQNWNIENPYKYPQRIESFWNHQIPLLYHTYDEKLNRKFVSTEKNQSE